MTRAEFEKRMREIEEALARVIPVAINYNIVNDPEADLERFRGDDDGGDVLSAVATFPGAEWYAEYARACREGDHGYADDLLRRGAAAIRTLR
jgi:hypothetical protein